MQFRNHSKKRSIGHLVSAPVIYSVIFPVILMDAWVEVYHRICFPLYGIPYVPRKNYIRIDRHKLSKLTAFEKLNCVYCQYVNNWINYVQKIAGETEKYWCGIKQKKYEGFVEPKHNANFEEREKFV